MDRKDYLLRQIDEYFEARLSDEEEKEFLHELACVESDDPLILEAKAVAGFKTISSLNASGNNLREDRQKRDISRRLLTMAASVIVILACGTMVFYSSGNPVNEHRAYLGGKENVDEEMVLNLTLENLSELREGMIVADEELKDELSALLPVAEMCESGEAIFEM